MHLKNEESILAQKLIQHIPNKEKGFIERIALVEIIVLRTTTNNCPIAWSPETSMVA